MSALIETLHALDPQPKIGDHRLIRHSYDGLLTAAARLLAFARMQMEPYMRGLVYEQQSVLAIDDLITFAMHSRRFIENTVKQANVASIPLIRTDGILNRPLTLTRIVNVIIHNVDLRICRTEAEINILRGQFSLDDFLISKQRFLPQPVCFASSDHGQIIAFLIGDLIWSFQSTILDDLVEFCAGQRLYLDDLD